MRLERVLEHAGSCLDGEASCFVAFAALYVVKVPMHPSFADFFFQPAEIKKTHETIQRAMTMDSVLQALEASNAAYVARLERNGVKDALTEALPGLFRGSHRQLVEDMAARFANEMRAARTVQKQQCQEASAGSSGPRAYGQSFATVQMVTEYKYYGVIIMERLTATNLPACASLLGKSSHDRNPASRTTFLARGGILHGDLVAQNFGISKRRTGGVELQLVALFERARRLCSDADENSDRTMQLLMTAERSMAVAEAERAWDQVINAGADDEATKVAAAKAKSLTSSQGVKVTYGDLVKKYEKRANIKPKNKGRADPIRFKQQDAKRKDLSASPEKEQQNQSAPSALSGVEATNRAVLSEWLKHEELASGLEKSLGEEIKNPHIQAVFLKDRYWK
eukprot:g15197.t1